MYLRYTYTGHLFFLVSSRTFGILVPQAGIKPMMPPLGTQSLNHWITREVPEIILRTKSDHVKILVAEIQ